MWEISPFPSHLFMYCLFLFQTYSHELFFDRDTIVHIEQTKNNNFICHVYKISRGQAKEWSDCLKLGNHVTFQLLMVKCKKSPNVNCPVESVSFPHLFPNKDNMLSSCLYFSRCWYSNSVWTGHSCFVLPIQLLDTSAFDIWRIFRFHEGEYTGLSGNFC